MSERGAAPGGKQGVHGWRAFLLVFGAGTLAAFLVVGLIEGGLRIVSSTLIPSSEDDVQGSRDPSASGTGKPVATLPPGKLDVCSRTLPSTHSLSLDRVDAGEDYLDSALEEKGSSKDQRMVSDECYWKLNPDYNSIKPWDFHFSYEAVISSAGEGSRERIASRTFDEWKGEIDSYFSSVGSKGGGEISDQSYVVYGDSADEGDTVTYVALVQTRSAVYQIKLDAAPDSADEVVPEGAFEREVEKMSSRLETAFGLRIPE